MPGNSVPLSGAVLQCPHAKGVSERVRSGLRQTRAAWQADFIRRETERAIDITKAQRLSSQRDKHVIIERCIWTPFFNITFDRHARGLVQGYET